MSPSARETADDHPLMRCMHKPDPKAGPDEQDKRSVIAIEQVDVDQWLDRTVHKAQELLRLPPAQMIAAGPSSASPAGPT